MVVTPIEACCRRCGEDFHLFEATEQRRGSCPRCPGCSRPSRPPQPAHHHDALPVSAPPLWWLLADEAAPAARRLRARLAALVGTRSRDRRQG
jgi:hypothetical protein